MSFLFFSCFFLARPTVVSQVREMQWGKVNLLLEDHVTGEIVGLEIILNGFLVMITLGR